jgi:hypothetical protein
MSVLAFDVSASDDASSLASLLATSVTSLELPVSAVFVLEPQPVKQVDTNKIDKNTTPIFFLITLPLLHIANICN